MHAKFVAVSVFVCLISSAATARAGYYENARFGYAVEIPAGFSKVVEADNSDGGTARSADGKAELAVWGANLLDETFDWDVASRIAADATDGWSISYKAVKAGSASWSGSKGGRVAYSRAIRACAGQAAYFRIEYDRAAARAIDPSGEEPEGDWPLHVSSATTSVAVESSLPRNLSHY